MKKPIFILSMDQVVSLLLQHYYPFHGSVLFFKFFLSNTLKIKPLFLFEDSLETAIPIVMPQLWSCCNIAIIATIGTNTISVTSATNATIATVKITKNAIIAKNE